MSGVLLWCKIAIWLGNNFHPKNILVTFSKIECSVVHIKNSKRVRNLNPVSFPKNQKSQNLAFCMHIYFLIHFAQPKITQLFLQSSNDTRGARGTPNLSWNGREVFVLS